MIPNLGRTLLINVDGVPSGYAGYPGEEYISPNFKAVSLKSLQSVHAALYGPNPDRVFLNYRTRQLINLIHSTDLVDYMLELDSRITYDTTPIDEFFYDLFQVTVNPLDPAAGDLFLVGDRNLTTPNARTYGQWKVSQIYGGNYPGQNYNFNTTVGGTTAAGELRFNNSNYSQATSVLVNNLDADSGAFSDPSGGEILHIYATDDNTKYVTYEVTSKLFTTQWILGVTYIDGNGLFANGEAITVSSGNANDTGQVKVVKQTPPTSLHIYPTTFSGGLSNLIPLPGSSLQFRFRPGLTKPSWNISGYFRPVKTIDDIEQELRNLGDPLLVRIFRVNTQAGKQEPYLTFKNCWLNHPEQAYRMAGFLMAYIYQVRDIWTGN